jgi:tRNA-specific 2-thiouridylase
VLEIRPGENELVVGDRGSLSSLEFTACELNFVSGEAPSDRFECQVKTRYKGPSLPALVELIEGGRAAVRYAQPGPPAAPGQAAVFYSGDELLGGGIIARRQTA